MSVLTCFLEEMGGSESWVAFDKDSLWTQGVGEERSQAFLYPAQITSPQAQSQEFGGSMWNTYG